MSRGSDKVLAGYSTALTQRVTELTDWHRDIPRNYSSTSPRIHGDKNLLAVSSVTPDNWN